MKRLSVIGFAGLIAASVWLGFLGVGCDTVTQSGGTVITTDTPLVVATGRVAIVITVTDTNGTLYLPIRWAVSDPTLGIVTRQGALTALYEGNAQVGINTITVKDQGNAEGFSVVNHVPADGIDLTPKTNSISGAGQQMRFEVAPDAALALPLVWRSANEGLGFFVSFTAYGAVYQATGARGDNYVTVSDQMGASASAIVFHR